MRKLRLPASHPFALKGSNLALAYAICAMNRNEGAKALPIPTHLFCKCIVLHTQGLGGLQGYKQGVEGRIHTPSFSFTHVRVMNSTLADTED